MNDRGTEGYTRSIGLIMLTGGAMISIPEGEVAFDVDMEKKIDIYRFSSGEVRLFEIGVAWDKPDAKLMDVVFKRHLPILNK